MYKGVGDWLCCFYPFFLNIPWKLNNLASLRPNYCIFIGYFKTAGAGGGGVSSEPPEPSLDPPLMKILVYYEIIWFALYTDGLLERNTDVPVYH